MGRKYQVISGDGHLETPPDFVAFLPEKYKDRAPKLITLPDGGGDACGVVVTMISSCIGGVDVGAVLGVATLVVSVRANSSDTEATRAIAATIAAIPTIHGQRAVLASAA